MMGRVDLGTDRRNWDDNWGVSLGRNQEKDKGQRTYKAQEAGFGGAMC